MSRKLPKNRKNFKSKLRKTPKNSVIIIKYPKLPKTGYLRSGSAHINTILNVLKVRLAHFEKSAKMS